MNEPAFPLQFVAATNDEHHYGLTKLEYASIKAMQGLLANPKAVSNYKDFEDVSSKSIRQARELLKQLEAEK